MDQQQQQEQVDAYYEFQAGVTACLRSWSALRTAVASGWGPVNKAEEIREIILTCMDGKTKIPKKPLSDLIDLEDYLAIFLEEEFSIVLEDESEKQVADLVFTLYERCCFCNDFSLSRQLVQNADRIQSASTTTGSAIQIQSPCEDIDDDDDDLIDDNDDEQENNAMEVEEQNDGVLEPAKESVPSLSNLPFMLSSTSTGQYVAKEYASQPLFGACDVSKSSQAVAVRQLGEKDASGSDNIVVDEEGFAPVINKKKQKG